MPRRGERGGSRPAGADRPAREPCAAPRPPLLALQRVAGNAAVTRLLQRDTLPIRRPALDVQDTDYASAIDAVWTWFDGVAAEARGREAGSPVQSVAELVWLAGELTFTDRTGGTAKVRDHVKPAALERWLRDRARNVGVQLLDHRGLDDIRGVRAEAMAILSNLGRIPTDVTFGSDADHITVSLSGTVTAEARAGAVKVEGEASAGGVEGRATVKGRVGQIVEALAHHGAALKKAVGEVAEKARKSASQAKPGWSIGVGVKGDRTGGYGGTVTLTWLF